MGMVFSSYMLQAYRRIHVYARDFACWAFRVVCYQEHDPSLGLEWVMLFSVILS